MRRFLLFSTAAIAMGILSPAAAAGDVVESSFAEAALADAAFDWSPAEAAYAEASASSFVAPDGSAMAVGGGRQGVGPVANTFAFFARRDADGTTTGRMFFRFGGNGETLFAPVECLAAAAIPGGGGTALIRGELDPPFMEVGRTLNFFVTDTAVPAGQDDDEPSVGDQLSVTTPPELPGDLPCEELPSPGGGTPITSGNIIVRAG